MIHESIQEWIQNQPQDCLFIWLVRSSQALISTDISNRSNLTASSMSPTSLDSSFPSPVMLQNHSRLDNGFRWIWIQLIWLGWRKALEAGRGSQAASNTSSTTDTDLLMDTKLETQGGKETSSSSMDKVVYRYWKVKKLDPTKKEMDRPLNNHKLGWIKAR